LYNLLFVVLTAASVPIADVNSHSHIMADSESGALTTDPWAVETVSMASPIANDPTESVFKLPTYQSKQLAHSKKRKMGDISPSLDRSERQSFSAERQQRTVYLKYAGMSVNQSISQTFKQDPGTFTKNFDESLAV
jgi:hypothetical protein